MIALLVGLLVLGTSLWLGGLVAIVVVARLARRILEESSRIALFRALGRAYVWIGGSSLALMLICGGILFATRPWNWLTLTAAVLAAALVIVLALAVRQARGMSNLRRRALQEPSSDHLTERVRTGSRYALLLRAGMTVLSTALYVVAVAGLVG